LKGQALTKGGGEKKWQDGGGLQEEKQIGQQERATSEFLRKKSGRQKPGAQVDDLHALGDEGKRKNRKKEGRVVFEGGGLGRKHRAISC